VDKFQEKEKKKQREQKNRPKVMEAQTPFHSEVVITMIDFFVTEPQFKGNPPKNGELNVKFLERDQKESSQSNRRRVYYKVGLSETRQPVFV
jgi:hypothetical protein